MTQKFAGFRQDEVNGVPVLWRQDRRFKTFRLTLHARRPLDPRAAARSLLPGLLLLGTERDPDRPALSRRMESLYGAAVYPSAVKLAETHSFRLGLDAVSGRFLPGRPDQLGEGLSFLTDYLSRPRLESGGFPEDRFERERSQAANAVRALEDDKTAWARQRAVSLACEGEPMAIPEHGGLEAIEALQRQDPEEARKDFLQRGEMWAVAMGAIDGDELLDRASHMLQELPERQPEPIPDPVQVGQRERRHMVERRELQQCKQVLVMRQPRCETVETWVGRRLFFSMLGGGPHSRLFREVRENQSLAYYVSASADRNKGIAIVQLGLDEEAAEKAEAEILAQVKDLQAGNFDQQELDTAKAGILSGLKSVDDSISQRCAFTSEQWLQKADRSPAQQAELYAKADKAQVLAGAQDLWLDYSYLLAGEQKGAAS
ncbi:MAG: M16 family metallopeptidase [Planctomycetota bacterium]|jgi:predicted Zn-dependent peptidase